MGTQQFFVLSPTIEPKEPEGMNYIGDLHIHSHFSMATSKQLKPEYLDYWARLKGIQVVGTGDFTHPGWIKELKEKLEPAEEGLFRLKAGYEISDRYNAHLQDAPPTRFLLSAEISNIYKKHGKVRKIHNVVLAPDFETVDTLQKKLQRHDFNITSDGRPILGLDARDLAEMVFETNQANVFIPAHIWTPWFSALGAKSGFNSIDEAFEDMTPYIFAVETGLSSDPPMNWMISSLDRFTLVANSDAHSPEKLGRNANLFDTQLSYSAMVEAMRSGNPEQFKGTIDMFPQEGKYHYGGHRKCGIRWNPVEAARNGNICPVCGKKITMGVMNRVVDLSDRERIEERPNRLPFYSVIPLKEMLAEIEGVGENTKKVRERYHQLLPKFGTEFGLLLDAPLTEIRGKSGEVLAEAIRRMRNREVYIQEGFDGQYGEIKVFAPGEHKLLGAQNQLFQASADLAPKNERPLLNFDLQEYRRLQKQAAEPAENYMPEVQKPGQLLDGLNPVQQKAATHLKGAALVLAGPGTGKTRVLTRRIAWLIEEQEVPPESVLALTFTHKAAREMQERLKQLLKNNEKMPRIATFHGFGLEFLKQHYEKAGRSEHFQLAADEERLAVLAQRLQIGGNKQKSLLRTFEAFKQHRNSAEHWDNQTREAWQNYQKTLKQHNLFDIDDLLFETLQVIQHEPEIAESMQNMFPFILVDEYQDINQIQYDLLQELSNTESGNLYAIGDPNQAIYGFRGSDVRFISRFTQDFPEASVYQLSQSYRCSDTILQASGNILQTASLEADALQGMESQLKLQIVENPSAKSEAEFIARKIEEMMGGLRFFSMDSNISKGNEHYEVESLSEFAVLTRTKKQLAFLAEAMQNHSIPYEITGDQQLMQNSYIRVLMHMMRQLNNHNYFPIETAHQLHEQEKQQLSGKPVKQIVEELTGTHFPEFPAEHALLYEKLLDIAANYKSRTGDFLLQMTIRGEQDAMAGGERVHLMTIHAAKGLEFDCVFIAGCEDGLIPFTMFGRDIEREEERRLLYVGMTRAKKYLFLTHAKSRLFNNKRYALPRSPFLNQIERQYYERWKQNSEKPRSDGKQLNLFD